ncbi:MAG: HD domain-containing protein [Clostridia bacterium]
MNKIKKTLWICVLINIIFSFVEFVNIITPTYIIILLAFIYLNSVENNKISKYITILFASIGVIISILGFGTISIIISSILIISCYIYEKITVNSQKKYDEKFKKNKEEDFSEIVIPYIEGYDLNKIKNTFNNYVGNYDKNNYIVNIKKYHTFCTANNCFNIAKSLKLDNEGKYLAYLIGILHDIGRFEEVQKFSKLEDNNPMDHGDYAYDILKSGLLREYILDKSFDDIILKAVKNHNKFEIKDCNETEKMYAQIIRDADKLDIFKRLSEGTFLDDYKVTKEMYISDEVKQTFKKFQTMNFNIVKNKAEQVILRLSMVFDIQYKYTLKKLIKNNYMAKYLNFLTLNDETRTYINKCLDEIYVYIENKLYNL